MHRSNHLVWCFMIIFLQTSRSRIDSMSIVSPRFGAQQDKG